jgi:predicted small lipoprotein YifL
MRWFDRLARMALAGALMAALSVGGCGRKAALDPPPSASLSGDQAAVAPSSADPAPDLFLFGRPAEPPPQAPAPSGPPAARKTFFLDWLIK